MGNDQSKQSGSSSTTANAPTQYARMDGDRLDESSVRPSNKVKTIYGGTLVKMAYSGIWSIKNPVGHGPKPRSGHFTAYSQDQHTIFIGYGITQNEQVQNDVWALDTFSNSWKKLKLSGDRISPRTGASACMMGKYIVIFGGCSGSEYYSDLHTIDTETGYVQKANTHGEEPSPRSFPVIGIHNSHLYVWGGYDGYKNPKDLSIMEFASMSWRKKDTFVEGRSHAAYATNGSKIYGYGGSQTGGLIIVDMEKETVEIANVSGSAPSADALDAGMISTGKYLIYFGGKAQGDRWTLAYGMDIERLWWFVFFIDPDGITTTTADGRISNDGLLNLPQFYGFSVAYEPRNREILACLGYPQKNPAPLFVVSVGDALGVLSLREDMKRMFEKTSLSI
ncbi:Kelch motif family protein [Tritrichomonas foetus]|uniref:Kelch motif family protein n=1 Tax=Tritrichomonas foetus TaxID=1144522 RepID=A0A1J4J4Z0_9EUKA|nr:Kelch motif family protein [Tritrichomonas foetus]|eukprot:OHS93215.1 Kelch motif family protein [Tritrichomonas foetus]